MAEELKEDKLIIKKDNIVKKGARDGWELIKIIWLFLRRITTILIQLENSTKNNDGLICISFL